ncbi:MAG: FHA domain-containing protein [Planctomycetota bacterium]|nr:FHA domain-containing protein [Planctomycetota bacterium]MDA1140997.1 FHA domain-containing protein [Planctomycetota bacterium]
MGDTEIKGYLQIKVGKSEGQIYRLKEEAVVGRLPACDIVLSEPRSSKKHLRVILEEGEFVLEDLKSTNGTHLNGEPVSRQVLSPGDIIRIGQTHLEFLAEKPDGDMRTDVFDAQDAPPNFPNYETVAIQVQSIGEVSLVQSPANLKDILLQDVKSDLNISEATTESEMKRLVKRMATIQEVSKHISNLQDLDALLEIVMERLFEVFPKAERGYVLMGESVESGLQTRIVRMRSGKGEQVEISQTLVSTAMDEKRALLYSEEQSAGAFDAAVSLAQFQIRSMMCAPLISQDRVLGVLTIDSIQSGIGFTQEDLELLSSIANPIAVSIENSRLYSDITALNKSYERFVPKQFLSYLQKENIIDVGLGDHVQTEMTVLFTDIRDFTSLSEKMSPEENFEFVNAYLSRMGPMINLHNGFIDKYIGDAIMALFPTELDGLNASVAMLEKLSDFNRVRKIAGQDEIKVGIGLHTGKLMMGTVGDHHRMDGTVISDAVNLASRIEGLTKLYGVKILISLESYNRLEDPSAFSIRVIDKVAVKGKAVAVTIVEILEGEEPELKALKMKELETFENARQNYLHRNFDQAREGFERVKAALPEDKAVSIYLERCSYYKDIELPEDWDGTEVLKSK